MIEWSKDPEFQKLPDEQKATAYQNYFDRKLADQDFFNLPGEEQARIKTNFLSSHGVTLKTPEPEINPYQDEFKGVTNASMESANLLNRARNIGQNDINENILPSIPSRDDYTPIDRPTSEAGKQSQEMLNRAKGIDPGKKQKHDLIKAIVFTAKSMKDTSMSGLKALAQVAIPALNTPQEDKDTYAAAVDKGWGKAGKTMERSGKRQEKMSGDLLDTKKAQTITEAIELTMKPFELAASGTAGITELATQLIKKQGIDKSFQAATDVIEGRSPGSTMSYRWIGSRFYWCSKTCRQDHKSPGQGN